MVTESCTCSDDDSVIFIQSTARRETDSLNEVASGENSTHLVLRGNKGAIYSYITKKMFSPAAEAIMLSVVVIALICAVSGVIAVVVTGQTTDKTEKSSAEHHVDTAALAAKLSSAGLAPSRQLSLKLAPPESPTSKTPKPTTLQKLGQSACCSGAMPPTGSPTRQMSRQMSGLSRQTSEGLSSLTGRWMMHKVEGDVNAFLGETGIGWLSRTIASAAGHGVGQYTTNFRIDGNIIDVVENKSVEVKYSWKIGGGWQQFEGQAGPAMVDPFWEFDGVSVTANCKGEQYPSIMMFKLLSPSEYVEILTAQSGRQAKFFYKRQM